MGFLQPYSLTGQRVIATGSVLGAGKGMLLYDATALEDRDPCEYNKLVR